MNTTGCNTGVFCAARFCCRDGEKTPGSNWIYSLLQMSLSICALGNVMRHYAPNWRLFSTRYCAALYLNWVCFIEFYNFALITKPGRFSTLLVLFCRWRRDCRLYPSCQIETSHLIATRASPKWFFDPFPSPSPATRGLINNRFDKRRISSGGGVRRCRWNVTAGSSHRSLSLYPPLVFAFSGEWIHPIHPETIAFCSSFCPSCRPAFLYCWATIVRTKWRGVAPISRPLSDTCHGNLGSCTHRILLIYLSKGTDLKPFDLGIIGD